MDKEYLTGSQVHSQSPGRIGSLDGLRGIAILSVVLLHWLIRPNRESIESVSLQLYEALNQTAHGVDIFFVISGFLIGRILLSRSENHGFLKAFYIRRFLRIVPLYFAVIFLFFVVRLLFGGYPADVAPIWSYFLFVNNLLNAYGTPNIDEFGAYWSLAIEEQFYLSSALLAVFLGRKGVVSLAVMFVLGSLITRAAVAMSFFDVGVWTFTFGHTDPIGIGLLVAAALQSPQVSNMLKNHITLVRLIGLLSFIAFVMPVSTTSGSRSFGIDIFLISISVGSWILIKFLAQPSSLLAVKPLRCVGEMSFSLYILHVGWATYAGLVLDISGDFKAVNMLISFVLLLIVCRFLWVFVESPLITLGHNWRYSEEGFKGT
ncbi:MAG: acyltransferase [Alphaproteobacteria bacterium]|nr:acyltransferase [Alphaproteobacteria bacterium]